MSKSKNPLSTLTVRTLWSLLKATRTLFKIRDVDGQLAFCAMRWAWIFFVCNGSNQMFRLLTVSQSRLVIHSFSNQFLHPTQSTSLKIQFKFNNSIPANFHCACVKSCILVLIVITARLDYCSVCIITLFSLSSLAGAQKETWRGQLKPTCWLASVLRLLFCSTRSRSVNVFTGCGDFSILSTRTTCPLHLHLTSRQPSHVTLSVSLVRLLHLPLNFKTFGKIVPI